MLSIQFKKIPKLAVGCYCVGLSVVLSTFLAQHFDFWPWSPVSLLQTLIVGALIVVVGSIINTLHQFRHKKED